VKAGIAMVRRRAKKMQAPPGLELPSDVPPSVCIIDIARRIQRVELLLFHMPDTDFQKLDAHVTKLLAGSLDDAEGCLTAEAEEPSLPKTCEFPNISEVSVQPVDSPWCEASWTDALDAKVSSLEVSRETLLSQMARLQISFDEMQASRANLVNEVVCGVQGLIASRVGTLEDTVAFLSNVAEAHTTQINKVIDKNDHLLQMLDSMVAGVQPTASQEAGRCKTRLRK
jgi:hypothetical protein